MGQKCGINSVFYINTFKTQRNAVITGIQATLDDGLHCVFATSPGQTVLM